MAALGYYVKSHSGKIRGPVSGTTLRRLAAEGKLQLSWEISSDKVKWCVAAKVRNLFDGLEGAISENLPTAEKHRNLTKQEVVAIFIDKFVLDNENFHGSFPFIQELRTGWARLTLPKDFVITEVTESGVHYIKYNIDTGDTREIGSAEASEKIATGITRFNWFTALVVLLATVWFVSILYDFLTSFSITWGTLKTVIFLAVGLVGFIIRSKKSKVFVGYELDDGALKKLGKIAAAISNLSLCGQVWMYRVRSNMGRLDWKYHAGDSFTVAKLPIAIFNRPIPNVETNVRVPGIAYGSQAIYFLPEKILTIDGSRVEHVHYSDLQINLDFIEYVESEGHVYSDSQVIEHRWKFINRDGSRDKRFKNNIQLPVMRCGLIDVGAGTTNLKMMTTNPNTPTTVRNALIDATGDSSPSAIGRLPTLDSRPSQPPYEQKEFVAPSIHERNGRVEESCSYCGEQILVVAIKCKHCGEMLD